MENIQVSEPIKPEMHFDYIPGTMSGFVQLLGKWYPAFASPPTFNYVVLFGVADGGKAKVLLSWCMPYQLWSVIIYQVWQEPFVSAKVVQFFTKEYTDRNEYLALMRSQT